MVFVRFLVALACTVFITTASAQSSVWKVTKGGETVYIGGTCHVLRAQDYPLPAEFDLAYLKADRLFFEIDPAVAQDPSFAMQVMQKSTYTDGRTLETVLSKEAYKLLSETAASSGIPIAALQQLKPGLVLMMISMQELMQLGVSQEGVDLHYANRAQEDEKPIGQLETPEFQLEMIVNMGEGNESNFVLMSLQDLEGLEATIADMLNAWRAGDLESLDTLFNDSFADFPKLREELLVERNRNWIPKIEAMFETPEIEYVLFGVGHAAGDDGVLAMLKAKGFTVEQLVAE